MQRIQGWNKQYIACMQCVKLSKTTSSCMVDGDIYLYNVYKASLFPSPPAFGCMKESHT